jgi:hypothetical protein
MMTFTNGTWLYANSLYADPTVCGYFVGIANAGTNNRTFQIIRSSAHTLGAALIATVAATSLAAWFI